MQIKKIALLCAVVFLSAPAEGKVFYEDSHQGNMDFSFIPVEDLRHEKGCTGLTCQYLLALHDVRSEERNEEGIRVLKALAEDGFLDAKYDLYRISKWNKSKSLPPELMLRYLKEAANENYAEAQLDLGFFYAKEKDKEKAHYWLERSAENNNPEGLSFTASDYYGGYGVAKDYQKGFEWLTYAYNNLGGHFDDWKVLGQAYERGWGTPKDLVKAYMCYDELGTAGIEEKARIAPLMTAEQQAEGLRLSFEWQQKYHSYTFQSLGLTHQQDGSYR